MHVIRTGYEPRYAPSASLANSFGTTFMENLSIIMKYSDDQSISLSNADVNFDAEMHKCDKLSVQPTPGATINYSQSMEIIPKNHSSSNNFANSAG